jgi:pyridoxal 5-phosphate dependent beta-lyase
MQLGELLGMPSDAVAFVESATAALTALLGAWDFAADAADGRTVAVAPTEWGPNLSLFAANGFEIKQFPVDVAGRVDPAGLQQMLADTPVSLVHVTQIASHRGLLQPVAEIARICREANTPLWVDAAQALGHVDTATGADAIYATSRKWLTGPRGVGLLAVAQRRWEALRVQPPVWAPESPPVRSLESHEAHIAGRVGLCAAVAEHIAEGPERIRARLAEVGRLTRKVFADLPGWEVGTTYGDPGAITALRPLAGQDIVAVRKELLEKHGILTTACLPLRAPLEMAFPLLRLSPHVDVTEAELQRARAALEISVSGAPRATS